MKKKISLLIAGLMLCGSTLIVSATVHECAFSYMGTGCYATNHVSYHTYLDENSDTKTCEVVVDQYRDTYKCACGNSEYRNYRGVARHTARCGQ